MPLTSLQQSRRMAGFGCPIGCTRSLALALALALALTPGPAQAEAAAAAAAAVRSALDRCFDRAPFSSLDVGCWLGPADGGPALYERGAALPLIPASVIKVVVSGAALALLPPDGGFTTRLLADGPIEHGSLRGDLWLVGGGDPLLRRADLERAADEVARQGIARVLGAVRFDLSYLAEEGPRFPPDARHRYAPPSALTVDGNRLRLELAGGVPLRLRPSPPTAYATVVADVRLTDDPRPGRHTMTYEQLPSGDRYTVRGGITAYDRRYDYLQAAVTRPGLYAATLLREALGRRGVIVSGGCRKGRAPAGAREVLQVRAAGSLLDSVRLVSQESDNVVAELLCRDLGARLRGAPGTLAKGLDVLRAFAARDLGLGPAGLELHDACGLSPKNRVTAAGLGRALGRLRALLGEPFVQTLAAQGVHPHARTPAPPPGVRLLVKTGTLEGTGVNALAGYLLREGNPEPWVLTLLVNRRGPGAQALPGTWTAPVLTAVFEALAAPPRRP